MNLWPPNQSLTYIKKMGLPLEDPMESLGYEITTLLQFSFFGLIGQLILAILVWITYSDTSPHLGFVSLAIYFVIFIASCEQDWETLNGEIFPPNEDSQAIRIIVDTLLTLACWDYLKLGDIFGLKNKHQAYKSGPEVVIKRYGAFLSCIVFLMGSYIGSLAYLSLFRLVTNWVVGGRMILEGLGLGGRGRTRGIRIGSTLEILEQGHSH